jgi:hypothetical protein
MDQEEVLMERNRDKEEVNRRRLGMEEREGRGAKKSAEGRRRRGGYSGWVRNKWLPECLGACAPPLPSHTAPSPATLHLSLPSPLSRLRETKARPSLHTCSQSRQHPYPWLSCHPLILLRVYPHPYRPPRRVTPSQQSRSDITPDSDLTSPARTRRRLIT